MEQKMLSKQEIAEIFEAPFNEVDEYEILYTSYDQQEYGHSDIHILLKRDGKIFEIVDHTCSCNSLSGCFLPEEITEEAMLMRSEISFPQKKDLAEIIRKNK